MFVRPMPGWPVCPPDVRWGQREAVLCLVGAQILAVFWAVGAHSFAAALTIETETIGFLLLGNLGLWLSYYFGPAAISKIWGRGSRIDFNIGITPSEAVAALGIGMGLQLVVLPALYWPIQRFVDEDPGASARELVDRIDGPIDVVLLAVAVVLVAPVVEERFYRGLLLPALTASSGVVVGLLGTSFLFALVHQSAIVIPGLTLFGLVVAWMTATTGRIGPAIVTHMAFNATTVTQLLLSA